MKKLLTFILICVALSSKGQDTTIVLNQALPAYIIRYMMPSVRTTAAKTFWKFKRALEITNAQGTTSVTIDTIPTVTLARLYAISQSAPGGHTVNAPFTNAIAAKRAANSYLNTLCNAVDARLTDERNGIILAGERMKNDNN